MCLRLTFSPTLSAGLNVLRGIKRNSIWIFMSWWGIDKQHCMNQID